MTVMDTSLRANLFTKLLLVVVLSATTPVWSRSGNGRFLNQEAFLVKNLEDTTKSLASAMRVSCPKDGIYVSFNRRDIIDLGVVFPSQLTFLDPECTSTANDTHFLLHTKFLQCDTQVDVSAVHRKAEMKNAVVVSSPTTAFDTDEDVPGLSDEGVVEISFSCKFNGDAEMTTESPPLRADSIPTAILPVVSTTTAQSMRSSQPIAIASIILFNTDAYTQEVNAQDLPITRGTSLYAKVEAFRKNGVEHDFYIQSCHLSRQQNASETSEIHYLIKEGCPSDSDVQLKPDPSNARRKFLFRARRLYGNKAMYLHCSLVPCRRSQECASQQSYCSKNVGETSTARFLTSLGNGLYVVKRPKKVQQQISLTTTTKRNLPTILAEQTPAPPKQIPVSCPTVEPAECKCPKMPPQQSAVGSESSEGSDDIDGSSNMISLQFAIVVAVITFLIGALLVGLLWFLYNKTDPRRKMQPVAMSDNSSSSQESTVPTVKLMSTTTTTSSYDS